MTEIDNVFSKLTESFESLTKRELLVANYILSHKMDIPYITISELAAICDVSIATVTRLVQKLSFESFRTFKLAAYRSLSNQGSIPPSGVNGNIYGGLRPEDSVQIKIQKLHGVEVRALNEVMAGLKPESISNAVKLLREARSVFCFGQGNSSIIAMEAWGSFATITKKFHYVSNGHLQAITASQMDEHDVILYFSFSGATVELLEIRDIIQRTGAKLILVTRFPSTPGAVAADVVIVCGVDESPYQRGSVSVKIAQLFIIDILYNEYFYADSEVSQSHKRTAMASTIPLHE